MSENGVVEKKSIGQIAKAHRKPVMAEPSKPITMFLHDEDRIKELFKGLKIADCSRLSLPIEEEESVDLDAGKYSILSICLDDYHTTVRQCGQIQKVGLEWKSNR